MVENDTPTKSDNSPRPEDGVQPTQAEIDAIIVSLFVEDEED